MLGSYTLVIRNANTNRILRKVQYTDRYYSGNAMMDECFYWKQHYREKGIQVTTDW
jgi:uncharacterized protein involved in tellurium resistance